MLRHNPAGSGGRPNRLATEVINAMRTVNHGGGTWRLRDQELRQPQDGAPQAKSRTVEIETRLGRTLISEPEDARLTGGTRSLTRRLAGLNIESPRHLETASLAAAPAPRLGSATAPKLPSVGVRKIPLHNAPAA